MPQTPSFFNQRGLSLYNRVIGQRVSLRSGAASATQPVSGHRLLADRDEMNRVLRDRVVPVLRERGFRGSMPHFRCVVGDVLRLLTFQFRSPGGSFVVELGHCAAGDFTTSYGATIPQSKMNVTYLSPRSRFRLGALTPLDDHWFDFAGRPNGCDLSADEVLTLLESDADRLWSA